MSSPGHRKDPLPVFCFKVELVGGGEAFFKSVSGLKYETEAVPVREGGANDTTFMLPGSVKWNPISLKQGFTNSSALLKWRAEWMRGTMKRITGSVIQLDTALKPRARWKFHRGWPSTWEMAEFDASKSEVAIETLTIQIEGITYEAH